MFWLVYEVPYKKAQVVKSWFPSWWIQPIEKWLDHEDFDLISGFIHNVIALLGGIGCKVEVGA
jgi:hypothetical protein